VSQGITRGVEVSWGATRGVEVGVEVGVLGGVGGVAVSLEVLRGAGPWGGGAASLPLRTPDTLNSDFFALSHCWL
jgi:hypothetical protein